MSTNDRSPCAAPTDPAYAEWKGVLFLTSFMPRHESTLTRDILLLIGMNVVLRALWLSFMHPPQALDFEWYFTHAAQMASGHGYRQGQLYTAYWPIGYPFFLSLLFRLTGPSVMAGLVTNAALSTGIVLLVYGITQKLIRRPNIALFASIGYTLLPSQIEWNSVLGSEELFTALLLLSLLVYLLADAAAIRWPLILTSGILLGLSCDVRPIPLLLPIAIGLYEWWIRRTSLRRAGWAVLILFVGVAIGLCPVTIRNAIALHHFVLISTNGGVNLWQGTHTDGSYFWSWNPYVNPLLAAGSNQILEGSIGTHVFLRNIIHHPMWTVMHGVFKWFFLYWVDWNVVGVTFQAFMPRPMGWLVTSAMWFDTIAYWLWMLICIIGFVKGIRLVADSWKVVAVPLTYIAYNTAVFFFFPAWDRFRYPMMPLFAILFGLGVYAIQFSRGNFTARITTSSPTSS